MTPAMVPQLPRFPVPPHPATMYRPTCSSSMVVPPPPPTSTKLADLQLQLDAHPVCDTYVCDTVHIHVLIASNY